MGKISEIKKVNERIAVAKIEIEEGVQISVIQVYAPTMDAKAEETD